MKILFIADTYETGGAFFSLMGMIDALTSLYDNVTPVILTSKYGKTNEFANERGIENYSVGHKAFLVNRGTTIPRRIIRLLSRPYLKWRYYISNKKAIELAEKNVDFSSIDLIHSNSNRNDIGAILAKRHNIPHVWHIREFSDWDYECFSLRKDYISFMNDNADRFIAISKAVAKRWIDKGLDSKKVSVIYNGVNNPQERIAKKRSGGQVRAIMVGFIAPFKGQLELLKAISHLDKDLLKSFKLDIYGNSAFEYLLRLKLYVSIHGLNDIVSFKGYASNVDSLYPAYDVGFMCSKAEGFGRVTIEYMLNGLCVIASDTGANQEIVEDGISGFIYKYGDTSDLSSKIKHVITDGKSASCCADRGYQYAIKSFTKEINAKNVHELYEVMVDGD